MQRYLILADDFTGANDTGVQLRRKNLVTHVQIGSEIHDNPSIEALVLDTESRNTTEQQASLFVREALSKIQASSFSTIMKKVDSTLRGNLKVEVLEAAQFCDAEVIVVCPAFPDLGRTVKGGRLYVHGVPLLETEHGKDPRKPVTEDNLVSLFSANESGYSVIMVPEDGKLDQPDEKIIYVCDATKNADLLSVVAQAQSLDKKILYVGSAGLADALVQTMLPAKGVLALVASLSQVTREQLEFAKEHQIHCEILDVEALLTDKDVQPVIDRVLALLAEQKKVVVASSSVLQGLDYDRSIQIGKQLGMTKDEVAAKIRSTFSKIGKTLVQSNLAGGLFLTGGDTAFGLLEELGVDEVKIIREIQLGIPLLEVVTKEYEKLRIITKAGAFGSRDSIAYALRVLTEL